MPRGVYAVPWPAQPAKAGAQAKVRAAAVTRKRVFIGCPCGSFRCTQWRGDGTNFRAMTRVRRVIKDVAVLHVAWCSEV
ncbi:UNVERIFIED_CONTAM: hypothetical protein LK11_10170 [Mumia flava]